MRFFLPALVLAVSLSSVAPAAAPEIEVGKPFPDLVLPSLDGKPMSIRSFTGKRVALIVFASW